MTRKKAYIIVLFTIVFFTLLDSHALIMYQISAGKSYIVLCLFHHLNRIILTRHWLFDFLIKISLTETF